MEVTHEEADMATDRSPDLSKLPPPPVTVDPAVAAAGRRRRRLVAAVLLMVLVGFAAGLASLWLFHDDVEGWALWSLLVVLVLVPFVLVARPVLTRRAQVVGVAVVLVVLAPWAVVVHAALPHGWIDEARRDVAELTVPGLEANGDVTSEATCTDYLDDTVEAYAAREFHVASDQDPAAVRAQVDEHFRALGYVLGEDGTGRRGRLTYTWSETGGGWVRVVVEVDGCGLLDEVVGP